MAETQQIILKCPRCNCDQLQRQLWPRTTKDNDWIYDLEQIYCTKCDKYFELQLNYRREYTEE